MFGDRLYTLTERDVQARYLTPVILFASSNAASNNVNTSTSVPNGFALNIRSIVVEGVPDQTQATNNFLNRIHITPATGLQAVLAQARIPAAVNLDSNVVNWSGEMIIPEGATITGRSLFSTALGLNTCRLSIFGFLIPMGNIETL